MELWGGIECSWCRIEDRCSDQLASSGHYDRHDDLARIAALGIRTLRYPLLWERAATAEPGVYDFSFADNRVPLLRSLGITPIVGLVHHGAGPAHTSLLDGNFAAGLAQYAGALIQRFPDLMWFTPVNEPLTTARFSGLYGLWHPHARSSEAFARILVNQCRATALAMRAIRAVNPEAKLVQTDDLGTVYSTPRLEYQARFENQRRWLGWDLMCGSVTRDHPMHAELLAWGIAEHELAWFADHPCPPDVIGIDHYVTSDRYLDEHLERYPERYWGGNAFERYADVEAVRVLARPGTSRREVIVDAARRYQVPIALTEVHIGCVEENQIHWLHEAWTTCAQLRDEGVDVRAVTAWALLGSYGWDALLTRDSSSYEAGAFCLRAGAPRATAVAEYLASLARASAAGEAVSLTTHSQGWWQRPERLLYVR